ncbi:hypothetical protein EYF80_002588 [Liparis tanakae]|uniref:Uncharacterized protein n=1 Tax=Liparis tanakae TaxID=230148 RepID=A0A4Z2JBK7_9TELE|nr:hypothetical protein EYF80_002588 [Liparis tanakae]
MSIITIKWCPVQRLLLLRSSFSPHENNEKDLHSRRHSEGLPAWAAVMTVWGLGGGATGARCAVSRAWRVPSSRSPTVMASICRRSCRRSRRLSPLRSSLRVLRDARWRTDEFILILSCCSADMSCRNTGH